MEFFLFLYCGSAMCCCAHAGGLSPPYIPIGQSLIVIATMHFENFLCSFFSVSSGQFQGLVICALCCNGGFDTIFTCNDQYTYYFLHVLLSHRQVNYLNSKYVYPYLLGHFRYSFAIISIIYIWSIPFFLATISFIAMISVTCEKYF